MKHNQMTRVTILMAAAMSMIALMVFGQEKEHAHATETKTEVPALSDFHPTIYELWHNAWPNKDYETLSNLLPDIEKHTAEIAAAELPGILREKKAAWDENVRRLQEIAEEYKAAVENKDNPRLLDAAEKLHTQFEKLVRTVRPALKELDEFHATLYLLYHYHTPAYDIEKIRASVAELQTKMEALNQAVLPKRHKNKEEAFLEARSKLANSLEALAASLSSNDEVKIKTAIETMHSDYEALQGVFE